jgi:XTP/dITP diphosphohydrolase
LLSGGTTVWLAGPTGDQEMARELGLRLVRSHEAELELVYGSWDPPGARLLDAVTVMDRLASPGGDPWKLAQTHESLARFLLEEAYEAYDAIESGDRAALREELGDVLLQVVLHARLADEWDVDDVAGDLVDKLVRRNPHVFGDAAVEDIDEITEQWERIKKAEKARDSILDGIALSQPALTLVAKILSRAARAGVPVEPPSGDDLGARLLRQAWDALVRGEDVEAAVRRAALALADRIRSLE